MTAPALAELREAVETISLPLATQECADDAARCDIYGVGSFLLWDIDPQIAAAIVATINAAPRLIEVAVASARWDALGKQKAFHVLTCEECARLESAEDRWCDKAGEIARRQLDAANAIRAALAALDGRA